MGDSGSIGSQVTQELTGIVKDVVAKLPEVIVPNTPSGSPPYKGGGAGEGIGGNDPNAARIQQKKAAAQQRFSQVKKELEEFILDKKRKEAQEDQIKEEEHMAELQKKESAKKTKENSLIGQLSRQYGGTGEIGKNKN